MGSSNSTMFKGIRNVSISGGTLILNNSNNQPGGSGPTSNVIPHSRQGMPPKPRVFHGRDDLVKEIANLLCAEATSRICILGPGGMGKTSLALAIVESPNVRSRYGSRCFWIPCIEATTPSLLLHILQLHLQIDTKSTDDILGAITSKLKKSKKPLLLLLDNFETPWFPIPGQGTQSEVHNILHQLCQKHVAVLVTMRGNDQPCDELPWEARNLDPVEKAASRMIFHDIYPQSKKDPDVDQLLGAVGHLPYAVTLMAKLGRKGRSPAKVLLDDWRRAGTGMISHFGAPEDNINRSISLSFNRPFVQQNPDAVLLLSVLSLLPAGTSKQNIRWWAPNIKSISSAIATLSDAALIVTKDDDSSDTATTLFVLPVVQSFMSVHNLIPDNVYRQIQHGCCQYIFDHAVRNDKDIRLSIHYLQLAAEDTNLRSILLMNSTHFVIPLDNVVDAGLRFANYCHATQPSIDFALHTVDIARNLGQDQYIAEALDILGRTYYSSGRMELSEECFAEAYHLCTQLQTEGTPQWLVDLTAACGSRLACLRKSQSSTIPFLRKLLSSFNTALSDHRRAYILLDLGRCLCENGQISEGLDNLHKVRSISKEMGFLELLAIALGVMASAYRRSCQLEEALKSSLEACEVCERFHRQDLHAVALFDHAHILFNLNRNTQALSVCAQSLAKFGFVGDSVSIGDCLCLRGCILMRERDYGNARASFIDAMDRYAEIGRDDRIEGCRRNLDTIEQAERSPEGDYEAFIPFDY